MRTFKYWTSGEDNYLQENYGKNKLCVLAENLNRSFNSVKSHVQKLHLKFDPEQFKERFVNRKQKHLINCDLFCNPNSSQQFISGYLMGYLWTDGYIGKKIKRKENIISLYIATEDLNDIKHLFGSGWTLYEKYPTVGKSLTRISCHSRKLYNFLEKLDFKEKSLCSPSKLLNNKHAEYIRGFWRGCLDGDGCFYYNPTKRKKVINISGTSRQDWTSYIKFLESLNAKYKIHSQVNGSYVSTCDSKSLLKIIDYLYPNENYDGVGLKRKFKKAKEMKQYIVSLMNKNPHLYMTKVLLTKDPKTLSNI